MATRRRKSGSSKKDAPTRGTAPSSPDIEKIQKFEGSAKARAATPSEVDAMGEDKRREVIGKAYGPSKRSQFLVLGSVIATIAVIVVVFTLVANKADQTPKSNPDLAPWSPPAEQHAPIRPQ